LGLLDEGHYKQWASGVANNMVHLKRILFSYKSDGYKLIGYGAAAKGNTVLNYIKFPLDFVIDDNPLKQDHFTPGQHCPIVPSTILDSLSANDKVVFVPLAWNFYDEITKRIKLRRNNSNDYFVKYFPHVGIECSSSQ
jgi:hypothetical protein